jgi:uncharacterized damage-inducible protein DinB
MAYNIKRHLQYNEWANQRLADCLAGLETGMLDREVVSSFPSIKKTLLHILDAETIWLGRIQGISFAEWPSQSFRGTDADLLMLYAAKSKELKEFIADKPESFLQTPLTYKNMKGDEFTQLYEELLFHVVNHGSFHRGQIITLLRQIGVTTIPGTDLVLYMRLNPEV